MAKNSERPGDLVLENRHLLLIFFAFIALSGVFFALGYIVGRNTFSPSAATAHADTADAESSAKPSPMPPAAYYLRATPPTTAAADQPPEQAEVPPELQFDQTLGEQTPEAKLEPAGSEGSAAAQAGAANQPIAAVPAPAGILVQVSALTRQEDADTLVRLLKEKKLPVMVTAGTSDALFHVVIGPYQSDAEAQQVKRLLEEDGFQPIIKH